MGCVILGRAQGGVEAPRNQTLWSSKMQLRGLVKRVNLPHT